MPPISDGTYSGLKNYVAGAIGRSVADGDPFDVNFARWLNIAIQRVEEMIPLRYCFEEKEFDVPVHGFELAIPGLIPQHKAELWGKRENEGPYLLTKRVFDSSQVGKNIYLPERDKEITGDPESFSFTQQTRLGHSDDLKITLYPRVTSENWKLYVQGYFYTMIAESAWTDATTHYLIAQEPAILQYSIAEQAFFYFEASNEKASPQHRRFLAEFSSTPKEGLAGLFYTERKAKEFAGYRLRITVPSDINADGEPSSGGNIEISEINDY